MMFLIILWLAFSILVGWCAGQKNRNKFAWCLLSMLLSPLIMLLALIAVPVRAERPRLQKQPMSLHDYLEGR